MFKNKVTRTIISRKLLKRGDVVLIAVSGGPDSMCLADLLIKLQPEYGLKLFVAHVNHGLRGRESDQDEAFVRAYCLRQGISFFSRTVDTEKAAKAGKLSLEDAARKIRYDFFFSLCREHKIDKIALAHTLDDQAETVLMRLLRGSGLRGFCGMKMLSKNQGMILIRPLLEISKTEILGYLKKQGLKSRTDKTNLKPAYLRNKIRLKLIPYLKEFNPRISEILSGVGESAAEVFDFVQEKAKLKFQDVASVRIGKIIFDQKRYLKIVPALRKELIRLAIEEVVGNLIGIEARHIKIVDKFIFEDTDKKRSLDLPQGLQVSACSGQVWFARKVSPKEKNRGFPAEKLLLERDAEISGMGFVFVSKILAAPIDIKKHSRDIEYFDARKLKFPLEIRARVPGDVFFPLGASGAKKLKNFFINQKISLEKKARVPLIVSAGRIAWVVGMRISEDFKVTEKTKQILSIQVKKLSA